GAVYDAKTNRYREVYTSVFYEVAVKGEIRKGRVAESNSVWPAGWFLSNYLRGYVRKVDLEFHRALRKPIAKALYPLLETGWYAGGGETFSKRYGSLCEEFLLTKHSKLVFIKRQLDPAHEELKKKAHSIGFRGGVCHRSSKASRRENLEIEQPVTRRDFS